MEELKKKCLLLVLMFPALGGNAGAECITDDCHPKMGQYITSVSVKHGALKNKDCMVCHLDHTKGENGVLKDAQDVLCYSCHEDLGRFIRESTYRHPLVRDGECAACHNPHGAYFTNLLPLRFPSCMDPWPFLTQLKLCFRCHEDKKPGSKNAGQTKFRNGDYNLHTVHVNEKKGRKCQACHDSHASNQERHIREEVPFGTGGWKLPIEFTRTATGGTCVVGCHREFSYDRNNPVSYE